MQPVLTLRGSLTGTVYIIGSGDQLDGVDPAELVGEQTITMNRVPLLWPLKPTLALTKYHDDARELLAAGVQGVTVARGDRGIHPDGTPPDGTAYVFDHLPLPPGWHFDLDELWPADLNSLINAQTVQMTAMHLAGYLGAERAVMLGCSGHGHMHGYYTSEQAAHQAVWLGHIRPLCRAVAERVAEVYGTRFEGLA